MPYFLRHLALFAASLLGAALFAAGIAALTSPGATANGGAFMLATLAKLPNIFAFDFGPSVISGAPAMAALAPALAATVQLLLAGLIVAVAVGVPLGAVLADRTTHMLAGPLLQVVGAIPIFAVALGLALAQGFTPDHPAPQSSLTALVFAPNAAARAIAFHNFAPPAAIVGLSGAGAVALAVWRAPQTAMAQPYHAGLRRLGLNESDILLGFMSRQALALALTSLGDVLLALFAAIAVVEWVFDWKGAGAQFIHAVALGDWPEVAAIIFLLGALRVCADLAGALAAGLILGWDNAP